MNPLIHNAKWRWLFLASIVGLLLAAMALVGIGWVKVKMLPFDHKSEFQIILNMPEGSALERTAQAAREIAAAVRTEPEVTDYQIYAGVASPDADVDEVGRFVDAVSARAGRTDASTHPRLGPRRDSGRAEEPVDSHDEPHQGWLGVDPWAR